MPYKKNSDLPDDVKNALPNHAQDIYRNAFNSSMEDGDEKKAHSVAWAAVKNKYEKKGEKWMAKESASLENLRQILQAAVNEKFKASPDMWPYIEDITDEGVIYCVSGQTYQASYSMSEDGTVVLGDPVKVVRQTSYVQTESLRKKYSEMVSLASTRPVTERNLQEAIELTGKALESEKQEDIDEATVAVDTSLYALRMMEAVKTEDGSEYPASAFAYVPDKEKPSTWKLRLWQDTSKKVTKSQLGRAAAALSPGGFRGEKASIPDDDLPAVKRKIRSEYRKLEVPNEEMPRWVKESEEMRLPITEFVPLTEAIVTSKGKGQVRIIKPGFNESKGRYYPKETLARDFRIFEGVKMYADHPTEEEDRARPERSIRDWVATIENVRVREGDGNIIGDYVIVEPWMEAKLARLRDAGQLDKIGVSINAIGSATKQKIDGVETNFIEKLVIARSVDFVTEAGAGGGIELFESNRDPSLDVDLVDVTSFKERRPDIVKSIEDGVKNEYAKEAQKKMENENKISELEGQVETLTTENTTLKNQIAESEKSKKKSEAQALIKESVNKADLPEVTKTRLLDRFKESESDEGVAEAIQAEITYIGELAEAGRIKNLGPSDTKDNDKAHHDALVESFKDVYLRRGKSEEEAQKMAETAARG